MKFFKHMQDGDPVESRAFLSRLGAIASRSKDDVAIASAEPRLPPTQRRFWTPDEVAENSL